MTYRVRYTAGARDDLLRQFEFLVEQDVKAARQARTAIAKGMAFLRTFPFSCRKATDNNSFLREIVIPFGAAGDVALFEIDDDQTVTILAVRHQREDDYH